MVSQIKFILSTVGIDLLPDFTVQNIYATLTPPALSTYWASNNK